MVKQNAPTIDIDRMDLYRTTQSGWARWSEIAAVVSLFVVLATFVVALVELREVSTAAFDDGKIPEVVVSYGDDPAVTEKG